MRFSLIIAASCILSGHLLAQTQPPEPPGPAKIEPGLETAVNWRWWVVPSDEKEWGFPPPEETIKKADVPTDGTAPATSEVRPTTYEVQKGDALIIIGKKFGMTAQQLKTFNGRTTDTIRIGEVLKIPTLEELKTMAPPPEPPKLKEEESAAKAPPKPEPSFTPQGGDDLLLQVFLDREQFCTGPIDGNPGPMFAIASRLYGETHEDAQNIDTFRAKARKEVGEPLTTYKLRPEDFRFIEQPAETIDPGRKGSRTKMAQAKVTPPTYEELSSAKTLVYRTPWEFVAERFHCDETFLKGLNSRIKGNPAVGAELRVPNVIPFEVEKAFEGTLQPAADPAQPVTAAIIDLSRLEISRDGKVVAMMPLGLARPDLRGRGAWTILDAIARPKLATKQESKDEPKTTAADAGSEPIASPAPAAAPAPAPAPGAEQYLAAGPNNPVGVVWINLAKAKSTEPLPYGLHGTSIPGRMRTQEGIGGLRMANWDIIRAVRLLPAGSPLQWK
jgi:LysM repeat protein